VPPAHGGRWSSQLDAVLHAIAISLDDDSFRVMQQAIEDSGNKGAVVVEDFRTGVWGRPCSWWGMGYGDYGVWGRPCFYVFQPKNWGGMGTPLFSCVSTEKLAAVDEAALSGRW